jgi:hypothetical protein
MDDEKDIFGKLHPSDKQNADGIYRHIIGFIRNVCDNRENIILEHKSYNNFRTEAYARNPYIKIQVVHVYKIVGIDCYSIYFTVCNMIQPDKYGHGRWELGMCTDYIRNIPYMPKTVLDMILTIKLQDNDIHNDSYLGWIHPTVPLSKFKKQIMDKLNEDPNFQQLSKLNIVQEIQKLQKENKKFQKEREYQSSELSGMRLSIHQMQEDMKQILVTTSKIQEENTQLTKLLHQEKEKTKQLSITIQESQCLSFTHANTIGQALMGNSDIFNCM